MEGINYIKYETVEVLKQKWKIFNISVLYFIIYYSKIRNMFNFN